VRVGARTVGRALVSSGWTEARFDVPEDLGGKRMQVSVVAQGGEHFGSAHYWLYVPSPNAAPP
jgi:hypothetical protein